MGITILLELRMCITKLRMRITNLQELFWKFGAKLAKKTEFIPARPDHQIVKKSENFSYSENHSQYSHLAGQLPNYILTYIKIQNWTESWHYILT